MPFPPVKFYDVSKQRWYVTWVTGHLKTLLVTKDCTCACHDEVVCRCNCKDLPNYIENG